MKITRCKYGHYYDKAYFRECPHCCRARGGRDEDFSEGVDKDKKKDIEQGYIEEKSQTESLNIEKRVRENENSSRVSGQKVGRKELEKVSEKTNVTQKTDQVEKQEKDKREKITEEKNIVSAKKQYRNSEQNLKGFMLFAAMPLKVIKNQEFCMDFCIFPEKDWETGAKMLSFKSQESIRDLKPVQMELPAKAVLHILYKEEEIFRKELELEQERGNVFCTFPVTVTDTRDRRFHMIKAVFEIEERNIEIPLYLMPNPQKNTGSL